MSRLRVRVRVGIRGRGTAVCAKEHASPDSARFTCFCLIVMPFPVAMVDGLLSRNNKSYKWFKAKY